MMKPVYGEYVYVESACKAFIYWIAHHFFFVCRTFSSYGDLAVLNVVIEMGKKKKITNWIVFLKCVANNQEQCQSNGFEMISIKKKI